MKNKSKLPVVLILTSLLSILFFLVLFSSVRCEPDDMITALKFRNQTLWQIILNDYRFNLFRPAALISFFSIGYSDNTNLYPYSIFGLFALIVLVFIFSTYKLINELLVFKQTSLQEKTSIVSFSVLIFTALYFLTTNRIEIFGWMSAFITHFMPLAFFVLSIWLIVKKTILKSDFLWLTLSAFLIAGGAEHITPCILIAIIPFLFYKRYQKYNKRLIYFVSCLIGVYIISVITPGTLYRIQETHKYVNSHPALQTLNPFYFIKMFFQPYKIIGLLLLFFSWLTFLKTSHVSFRFSISWYYFIFIILASLIITLGVATFAYKSFLETRLLFVVDFFCFITINMLVFKFVSDLKYIHFLWPFLTGSTLVVLLLFNFRHIPRLRNFAHQYDNTISSLKQQSGIEVITVNEFPDPDLTNQVALNADPINDVNQLFCRFHNIKVKVSVKK